MSLTDYQKAGLRQHIHNESQILKDDGTPAISGGSAAIDAAIAAHAAASDPHPGYDTAAEVSTAVAAAIAALPAGFTDPTIATGDLIYRPVTSLVDESFGKGTVSARGGGGQYSGATDGNTSIQYGGVDSGIDWFYVDLGSAKTIVGWYTLIENTPTIELYTSPDAATWTLVDSSTGFASNGGPTRVISPTSARYWRFYCPAVSTYMGVRYVTLYSSPAVAATRLGIGANGTHLVVAGGVPVWKKHEIAYVEYTAPVNVTAVTEAASDVVVSLGALTFDGDPVIVEFFTPALSTDNANNRLYGFSLFEDSTSLGVMTEIIVRPSNELAPVYARRRFTPSAGSHTYSIRVFSNNSTGGVVEAGTGGVGQYMPGFVRVERA